jgi:hypothetical protein
MKVELKVIANPKGKCGEFVPNLDEPDSCYTVKNLTESYFLDVLFKTNSRGYGMGKKEENVGFTCLVCLQHVMPLKSGSYRNHCPFCLSSLHVDDAVPGDRKSTCHGVMRAFRMKFNGKKGWQIVHKCTKCGTEKVNRIAEHDVQSDDWLEIVALSRQGL